MAEHTPQDTAERVLADCGADGCVVVVERTSTAYLRWAGNTVIGNGHTDEGRTTVAALRDTPEGTAAGVVSRGGVRGLDTAGIAEDARRASFQSIPSRDAPALPGPREAPASSAADWDAPVPGVLEDALAVVPEELGSVFARARAESRLLYGYAEHRIRTTYLASSSGTRLRHVQPSATLDLTVRAADSPASSWAGDSASGDPLTPFPPGWVASMDDRLRERPWRKERSVLPPGRYEVLLSPSCVADLMLHMYRSMDAEEALAGRTAFGRPGGGTRVGERLTRQPLTLRSDPGSPGLGCVPFVVARDAEGSVFDSGLALRPTDWIADGTLGALVRDRRSARGAGAAATPRTDSLCLAGPADAPSLADMVASTDRALLLTSLWYLRQVDPGSLLLTGLTRDGVYLVENGEITGAVGNFRFEESPLGMLDRVVEVGRTERTLPREWGDCSTRTAMPALRVAGFTMSSTTTSS
ncbi:MULTISPECIES: metallopeptidase TldD-related protein [unclassified Nocardiopsis]|uniref:metallopeptidase TldD-related protein n=1 Tax=unclassified Nocardiopsis TaxID=2649073 RepID=UPI00135AA2A0|nr:MULTISPECIES: metallopeptidase TldD-related protein [unclassified Nocardiopsis]